jgi:hypothetical protein
VGELPYLPRFLSISLYNTFSSYTTYQAEDTDKMGGEGASASEATLSASQAEVV